MCFPAIDNLKRIGEADRGGARTADVIVLAIGENEQVSRETGPQHLGDHASWSWFRISRSWPTAC
ncbi:MAG: hypothetical protein R2751_19530 [Bacteroidales bacterium]